jgi:exodeoxyribonuclease V beta subunit
MRKRGEPGMIRSFDLLNTPLEGTNLIEASAGTGKTYAIEGLFLRLLLEKDLSLREILVVTFTEAATHELKERIRRKLRAAITAFDTGRSEDPFLKEWIKYGSFPGSPVERLREALRTFDEAAIFTIHGFCMRVLHENAFESGSLFDTELVTEQDTLIQEIVDDFWRRTFYTASPLFVNYALSTNLRPDTLLSLLRLRQPYLKVIPSAEVADASAQEEAFKAAFDAVRRAWPTARAEVETILRSDEGLKRTVYRVEKIPLWVAAMDDMVEYGGNDSSLFAEFEKFTRAKITGSVKKKDVPPEHSFFGLCDSLLRARESLEEAYASKLLGLKVRLFKEAEEELSRLKRDRNIQSYEDLLLRLRRALEGRGGMALAGAIRNKYRAALIDEFQDTDPVQYAIFKAVFNRKGSVLFFVGDPKQAIYTFRGADIFAYMKAAADVTCRYTLEENWRSEPKLIEAINTLFSNSKRPFFYGRIPFVPSRPATRDGTGRLVIRPEPAPAFQVWFMDARRWAEPGQAIPKKRARPEIVEVVAAEISNLLDMGRRGMAVIGERPLKAGDIAVLVRKNREAILMQRALSRLNIPIVLYSTENLFDSWEALEMERFLAAVAEPNHEGLLKAALSTEMVGINGEGIDLLNRVETEWEQRLLNFRDYHEIWRDRGFMRMFRVFLTREKVLNRLIGFPDGERRITNLLHLVEVLHQVSVDKKLNMTGLLKWLAEQRDPTKPRMEEYQLRLESDEDAVNVVTIHKSKGLEYPVVFCPFSWDGSRLGKRQKVFTFHDQEDDMRLTLDLGSRDEDEHRLSAEKERLAENLRLLYVALTRAKSVAHLIWGRFNEAETSAPAYLIHPPRPIGEVKEVDDLGDAFMNRKDEEILSEVKELVGKAGGTVHAITPPVQKGAVYVPLAEEEAPVSWRGFGGWIDRQWKISSFSSLTSGRFHDEEVADRDAEAWGNTRPGEALPESPESEGIFAFPKGTKAGTFLHDLFEHMDFSEKDQAILRSLVKQKLDAYGYEASWLDTLCGMIQKVLAVALRMDRDDFSFSCIRNQDRLNELEFYFPLKSLSSDSLRRMLSRSGLPGVVPGLSERIGDLDFAPLRGFIKGFMDLVFRFEDRFYLVDWKSNDLGSRVEDYGPTAMAVAMDHGFYTLQYLIYTIALNRYLENRLPGYDYETHFGGIYYVFLRGVDPAKGREFGIFRDRPSAELVHEWSTLLID